MLTFSEMIKYTDFFILNLFRDDKIYRLLYFKPSKVQTENALLNTVRLAGLVNWTAKLFVWILSFTNLTQRHGLCKFNNLSESIPLAKEKKYLIIKIYFGFL